MVKINGIIDLEHGPEAYSEVSKSLHQALAANFKNVSVQVVDCPNLTQEPWNLVTEGLGGNPVIADVGGPDNLHYIENNNKFFVLDEITKEIGSNKGLVIGPGAGVPKNSNGSLSELVVNTDLQSGKCCSKFITTDKKTYKQEDYKSNEIGVLANLLISEGKPSKVLEIKCSQRTGPQNFVTCMRLALAKDFPNKNFGLGGVFQIGSGTIKAHVMPDFPGKDLLCSEEVEEWLQFFSMKAPLLCSSVFINNAPPELGVRMEHTHFVSKHGDGGHYHYDTSPDEVEYHGYYILCEKFYRVEQPVKRAAYFN